MHHPSANGNRNPATETHARINRNKEHNDIGGLRALLINMGALLLTIFLGMLLNNHAAMTRPGVPAPQEKHHEHLNRPRHP